MYGFQSYISFPIILSDGTFFGTLCAIDPRPAGLKKPETIGTFRLFAELIAKHLDAQWRTAATELLLKIMTDQRDATDPKAIMRNGAAAIGSFLKVERAGFIEVVNGSVFFSDGWTGGRLPQLCGVVPDAVLFQESFGNSQVIAPGSLTAEIGGGTLIVAPIIREEVRCAGFYVQHATERQWSTDEIQLIQGFAEQTWNAVVRARVEGAYRATQERLELALEAGGGVGTWDWGRGE